MGERVFSGVVGAAIVDDLEAPAMLLAAQRSYPENLRGLWEFPGGKVEPGEQPVAALRRELSEELGCRVSVGERVLPEGAKESDGDWPLAKPGLFMRVWLAAIAPGSPPPRVGDSHRELRWVGIDEAASLPWIPADFPILQALLRRAFEQI